jgi:asparagine synthase (glutamine-hydrolysing)
MCGFIYSYNAGKDDAALQEMANRALSLISHRGPDDEGIWCNSPCVIGHRRLSIIDIGGSHQPMLDPTRRYILAYNGEIYNFKELRETLKSEWNFHTRGDTEVVLAGLIIHGESFLQRMEGMWALSLWDTEKKMLLLTRDRMGKKPLYYQLGNGEFACASELNALSCLSSTDWSEDLNSTADYLRYGFYLPGTTAFQNVYEVLPGHALTWSPGSNNIRQKPYWSLSIGGFSRSKQEANDLLREFLFQAVKRRLIADVEVGAFLSGGIDSSLIVSILSKKLRVKPKTFTIGFSETSYDERKYARHVARLAGTNHFDESFEDWDREQLTGLILKNVGQPFADSSLLPTAMVSRVASSQVKVVLSGDGGDELFSGYQRYQARALLRWYARLPDILKKNIERVIKSIPEPMAHHSGSLLKKAHLFLDIVNRQKSTATYVAPLLYSTDNFKLLAPELKNAGHTPPSLPAESREDSLLEMMTSDALVYLPQDILVKVDRASMAYSLEARAPFLDHAVVELAFSIPRLWHRRGASGKRMLREAFSDLLPNLIWRRRKQGFGVPIHSWFRGDLAGALSDLLGQLTTPLEKSFVKQMLLDHRNGRRDHGYRLWNIYIYLRWLSQRPWQTS